MTALLASLLASTLWMTPIFGGFVSKRVDVDCKTERALEHALARAERLAEVDFVLYGVCTGTFVIARDGVTLRGATPESGIAAPAGDPIGLWVVEVVDTHVVLREMTVQGGEIGVLARGWDADVTLVEVEVRGISDVGVLAFRGAQAHIFDSTVRDGRTGVVADSSSTLNLQRSVVTNADTGVVVANRSTAAISDTTIHGCDIGGLNVTGRSDTNVFDSVFAENGQVHVNANDWSAVTLSSGVTIGSPFDDTGFALSVNRNATITSLSTPVLHGSVGALVGGSVRLGNTRVTGNVILFQFSNAHLRSSQVNGTVVCREGSNAICLQTTTGGASDCPSLTCGPPPGRTPEVPEIPVLEAPQFDFERRTRRLIDQRSTTSAAGSRRL